MPTIISHAAPALAIGLALGQKTIPPKLLVLGTVYALAPDLDSIGFFMGVPYESLWGHRGISHSIAAACVAGFAGFILAPALKARRLVAALFLFIAVISHIILDAATSGGLGPAALWPFDETRRFLSWRPIRVAPMHPSAMLSGRGLAVIVSEIKWIWLPCLGFMLAVLPLSKFFGKAKKTFVRGRL